MAGHQSQPPPYDKTGRDDDDLLQIFSAVVNEAQKLIILIEHSVESVVNALGKLGMVIAESSRHCTPSISMKFTELQTYLLEVVHKCHSYCEACKELGECGSDEEVIAEIMEELNLEKFDELNDFLEEIGNHLELCETRFTRYETAGTDTKKAVDEAAQNFESKSVKAGDKLKIEKAIAGATLTAGAGLAAAGARFLIYPPASLAMILGGVATGAVAAGISIAAGFTQVQVNIYNEACTSIIKLNADLATVIRIANNMREHIHKIKTSKRGGIDELKSKTKEAEKQRYRISKLIKILNEMKVKMSKLIDDSDKLMKTLEKFL